LYTADVTFAGTLIMCGLIAAQSTQPADARGSFTEWLDGVRAEALSRGIRQEIIDQALSDVEEPLPVIIERDRSQAERVQPLETYLSRRLSPTLIRTGREMLTLHKPTLERVSEQYGVPASLIAGIWGIESNFGRFSGVRPIIAALATLAWDPRRATLFRAELLNALEILNRGDIELAEMRGSWAGAMGQPQFLPSSYLQYAEDFDGDGRRDIWHSTSDVFASIANYLKGHGWTPGMGWGREVRVAPESARRITEEVALRTGSCRAAREMTTALPLSEWRRLGVRTLAGNPLPAGASTASLVSGTSRYFLVSSNYDALLEYNCAHAYALTVALLGDRLAASGTGDTPAKKNAKTAPSRQSRTSAKRQNR
jgi:membrane-bound lytic murein transglycosylase B